MRKQMRATVRDTELSGRVRERFRRTNLLGKLIFPSEMLGRACNRRREFVLESLRPRVKVVSSLLIRLLSRDCRAKAARAGSIECKKANG